MGADFVMDPAAERRLEEYFEAIGEVLNNKRRRASYAKGVLLADSAYGDSTAFREGVRGLGLEYAVGVHGPTKVWRLDKLLRRRGEPISVAQLALSLGRSRFRRVTWREGSKQPLWSRFACQRVVPTHDDGWDPAVREDVWLVIEWPDGEPEPTTYFFATLPPSWTRKQLVLSCYAFVVAERVRRFPPSDRRSRRHRAVSIAA